jgi:cytochrome c oxidase assembly protein subunit 11
MNGWPSASLQASPRLKWRNRRVAAALVVVVAGMVTLVSYSVPLYRLFCQVTGFGGTTQRAVVDSTSKLGRLIMVRFNTDVAPNLPWRFLPEQRNVQVHLGEEELVFFSAENLTDRAIVGHATFNVTPPAAGLYFNKIQCFCFDDERLGAHQRVDMPVDFFVDPGLAKDPDVQGIDTITLSYTFFRSLGTKKPKDLSRFEATAQPDPQNGQAIFEERCTACHALDRNRLGPMLGDVLGRRAGAAAGYRYSEALQASGITWSEATLDRWLANPRGFIPGARMPVRVLDPTARKDIIAYLRQESGRKLAASGNSSVVNHAP